MKLSTSTLPLPSGVDDNTALIGTPASQIRFTVALLKAFGAVIDEPSVELRTCVEPKSLIEFCATAYSLPPRKREHETAASPARNPILDIHFPCSFMGTLSANARIKPKTALTGGPDTTYGEEFDTPLLGMQCQDAILCF